MSDPVIVSAVRTAVGTARKGTLANTSAEDLATAILAETIARSGLAPEQFDDVIFAESLYGGGDLARYAAVRNGMLPISGVAVNRHCAGSLTAVGFAAAGIKCGMESAVIAGGVQASSMSPRFLQRVPGTTDDYERWAPATHPDTPEAPCMDMSITVGWNTAKKFGLTREDQDLWAYRSHMRAVAAIDAGKFTDEIVPFTVTKPDGTTVEFSVDEHPRRTTSPEILAGLKVLHPEIEGFSVTAGNASGSNDAASALALCSPERAEAENLEPMARVLAWGAAGVDPALTGVGALAAANKVLERAGRHPSDIALWEINEAFASVPVAVSRELKLDEERVNFSGSGCSIGHPISASGARMLTTLIYELRRTGGGLGLATMCAGGGMGGAVLIEV